MISNDTIATLGKFIIAAGVIGICGYIIATSPPDSPNLVQAWSAIFLIVGWIIRDSSGQSAANNAERTINATTAATTAATAAATTPSEPFTR